jgi:hypothetical protein
LRRGGSGETWLLCSQPEARLGCSSKGPGVVARSREALEKNDCVWSWKGPLREHLRDHASVSGVAAKPKPGFRPCCLIRQLSNPGNHRSQTNAQHHRSGSLWLSVEVVPVIPRQNMLGLQFAYQITPNAVCHPRKRDVSPASTNLWNIRH